MSHISDIVKKFEEFNFISQNSFTLDEKQIFTRIEINKEKFQCDINPIQQYAESAVLKMNSFHEEAELPHTPENILSTTSDNFIEKADLTLLQDEHLEVGSILQENSSYSSSLENIKFSETVSLDGSEDSINLNPLEDEISEENLCDEQNKNSDESRNDTVVNFISCAIRNHWITKNEPIAKKTLKTRFNFFKLFNPNDINDSEILSLLQELNLLKNITENENRDVVVTFKDHIFLHNTLNSKLGIRCIEDESKLVFSPVESMCFPCRQTFYSKEDLIYHETLESHVLKHKYFHNRKGFPIKLWYLELNNIPNNSLGVNENKKIEIIIKNITKAPSTVKILKIIEIIHLNEIKFNHPPKYVIKNGDDFRLTLNVCFTQCGAKIYPLVLKLSQNESVNYDYLLIEPIFHVYSKDYKNINLQMNESKHNSNEPESKIVRCEPLMTLPVKPIIRNQLKAVTPRDVDLYPKEFSMKYKSNLIPNHKNYSNNSFIPCKGNQMHKKLETKFGSVSSILSNSSFKSDQSPRPRIGVQLLYEGFGESINKLIGSYIIPEALRSFLTKKKALDFVDIPEATSLKKSFFDNVNQTIVPNQKGLNKSNYRQRFKNLLWIEEYKADEELHSYDQKKTRLIEFLDESHKRRYGIKMESLAEGRPSVLKGDSLFISVSGTKNPKLTDIHFFVEEVEEQYIFIAKGRMPFIHNFNRTLFDVRFELNRTVMRLAHHFLDLLTESIMNYTLFPSAYNTCPISVKLRPYFNQSVENNEWQTEAVKNIVTNTAFPAPFILFGPPGTGKTATLVEAIVQIWHIFTNVRICVCASSNTASDVITHRIMNYIPSDEMMRIYGFSRINSGCLKEFSEFSNYDENLKSAFLPRFEEFIKRRVVVMTPIMAGKIMIKLREYNNKKNFANIVFDYLFIDEASHTLETDLIIPITAFYSNKFDGHLILSGDPKQLGPVIQSSLARKLGYGMSYMERLMKTSELYQKDPITSEYNSKVIVKLINNYRSHETILHSSNILFYENELQIKASEEVISSFCQWEGLPNPNFPIIFHGAKGQERLEKNSPSYFNKNEIRLVENYLNQLFCNKSPRFSVTGKDIGIISPYKKQVLKIRKYLSDRKYEDMAIASVEEFQGQERRIIIISTVRSRFELIPTDYKFGLGFLRNEKRLNVALTRAKALLIVIGNPDILQCDPHWKFFIDYCIKNKCFVGETPCVVTDPEIYMIEKSEI